MKKRYRDCILFTVGAIGYGIIEIFWRGHTHWSMTLAGGISFLGLSEISKKMKRSCLLIKAAAGAALITIIEFVFGLIFNIILKKNVWDYSDIPFNFKGQICLLYSIFWLILCLFFIPFAGKINKKLENS